MSPQLSPRCPLSWEGSSPPSSAPPQAPGKQVALLCGAAHPQEVQRTCMHRWCNTHTHVHAHSAVGCTTSPPNCMHWWDLARSMLGRSRLPQGTAPGRIWLPEGSGSIYALVPSPVSTGRLGRMLSLMSLSSLPSPWQQKEETWLGAQVSAHRAGWAAGSPPGMRGPRAWAGLHHPLSPSEIPIPARTGHPISCWRLRSPRGGNGTQRDSGTLAPKEARALLPKASFYPPPQISPQEITSMRSSCIPWAVQGKRGAEGRWDGTPLGHGDRAGESLAPSSRAPTFHPPSCDSSSPIRKEKKKKAGKKHRRDR